MPHKRSAPISTLEVNAELWSLVKRCNELLREYHGAGQSFRGAKLVYQDNHAQSVLRHDGTIQEKKAYADVETKKDFIAFIQADTRFKYLKTALEITQDQMTALESIGSNMRQQNDLDKYKT